MRKIYLLLIIFIITSCRTSTAQNESGFIPISSENIDQLEFAYALPPFDGVISVLSDISRVLYNNSDYYNVFTGEAIAHIDVYGSYHVISTNDNKYLLVDSTGDNGVFDARTGKRLYDFRITNPASVSTDGNFISAFGDGIYDLRTGEKVLAFKNDRDSAYFINDYYAYVSSNDGIYRIDDWSLVLPIDKGGISSSIDGRFVGFFGDGVYEIKTQEKIINAADARITFSLDNQRVRAGDKIYNLETREMTADLSEYPLIDNDPETPLVGQRFDNSQFTYFYVVGEGLYDTDTKELLLANDNKEPYYSTFFLNNDQYIYMAKNGLYDLSSLKKIIDIQDPPSYYPTILPEINMFLVPDVGSFDLETGEKLYSFKGDVDYVDGKMLITSKYLNVYDVHTGKLILELPYPIFVNPDEGIILVDYRFVFGISGSNFPYRSGLVIDKDEQYQAVYARTEDNSQFRISDDEWIAAADVDIISMPEAVPIETP